MLVRLAVVPARSGILHAARGGRAGPRLITTTRRLRYYVDIVLILGMLAEQGVTAILKADGERMREGARPWTFVASGGPLSGRPIRIDDDSVDRCLEQALPHLRAMGLAVPA